MSEQIVTIEVCQPTSSNQLSKHQPLLVPKHVTSISIEVTVDKPLWFTYMVYDQQTELRAQYMIGKTPQPVVIHQEAGKTSPYTIAGNIHEGEWMIDFAMIGHEEIEAEMSWCECKVTFGYSTQQDEKKDGLTWHSSEEATFTLSKFDDQQVYHTDSKWYKGDFHTHTIYTDGQMTREENMISAKNQGLDFFVATDHNLVPTSWFQDTDILVIPGVEVTSMLGHFNIINAHTSPFSRHKMLDMLTEEGMNRILTADYGNCVISINHPFLTEWKWLLTETPLDKVDSIEIWNDPTYPYNSQATEWALLAWNYLLNDGYQLTGIGGSDSHLRPDDSYEGSTVPSLIGDPGTFVYCEQLTANNIIDSVKKGKVTVSRGGLIQLRLGNLLPGSSTQEINGTIKADVDTDESIYIEWVVDGEVVQKDHTNHATYVVDFPNVDSYHWVRVDVRYEDGRLYGFTNPIYFGERQPTMKKWGEILDIMNDDMK